MLRSILLALGLLAGGAAQANVYTVTNTNDSGAGSLRQAITSASATASSPGAPHIISFSLGGGSGSTHTITLGSALPQITKPTLLLGPSASTVIVTVASGNRGQWDGLEVTSAAEGSQVYFLTLRGFGVGLSVNAADFELVGSTLDDNRVAGLHAVNAAGLRVGNATVAGRNVFTRNGWEGGNSQPRAGAWLQCTQLAPSGSCAIDQDMALLGNLFGVQRDGSTPAGNVAYGIVLDATRGVVVGGEDNAANEIVHSYNSGILARAKAMDITIRENRIVDNGIVPANPARCANDHFANHCDGVTLLDAQGVTFEPQASDGSLVIADNRENGVALRGGVGQHAFRRSTIGAVYDVTGVPLVAGNGEHGVLIDGSPNNELGIEQSSAHANLIFGNGGDGIRVQGAAAVNNRFHRNLISGNGAAGIALASGGNPGAPLPLIDSLTPQVTGTVSGSGPGIVSIYADGDGEGAHYLGDAVLSGVDFSLTLDLSGYAGMDITAVATRGQVSSRFATPLSAPVPAGQAVVQVTRDGDGGVTSAPQGIACGEDCQQAWPIGTQVTLSGAGAPGWAMSRWSGGCSGFAATCQFVVQGDAVVGATFFEQGLSQYPIVFAIEGDGFVLLNGNVVCDAPQCEVPIVNFGQIYTFTATPAAGWQFLGWGDQCSGAGNCTLSVQATSGPRYAKAIFAPAGTRRLTVVTNGAGSVTSAPSGIDCPGTCAFDFASGSNVTLTPSPQPGWQFEGWTGACAGTGACVVSMSVAREVGATFGPGAGTQTLSVSVTGNGSVTSAPGSIDCPGNCSGNFPTGSQVTLVPTADPGWTFSGWGGSCSGTGSCMVTMSQARSVSASFVAVPVTHTLTVSRTGNGSVTSAPAGIDCPGTCNGTFSAGTQVVLTRSAAAGWSFAGWGGACSGGAPTCAVTMNADVTVQATFEPATNPDDAIFASSFEDGE